MFHEDDHDVSFDRLRDKRIRGPGLMPALDIQRKITHLINHETFM